MQIGVATLTNRLSNPQKDFFILMCMWPMCVHHMYTITHGGHKRASDPLKLQAAVSTSCWKPKLGSSTEQQVLLTAELLLPALYIPPYKEFLFLYDTVTFNLAFQWCILPRGVNHSFKLEVETLPSACLGSLCSVNSSLGTNSKTWKPDSRGLQQLGLHAIWLSEESCLVGDTDRKFKKKSGRKDTDVSTWCPLDNGVLSRNLFSMPMS